ncbi:unnamed protein product [Ceratitis capitata]|uniref:(Mediterranean fruit fly) hypothetical protein n=1 Tax=Ceratitis capitata TaxID=7213 RepID=A0A811UE82_CERCA|nr:unnamed protein product [Ceratitis capitata]
MTGERVANNEKPHVLRERLTLLAWQSGDIVCCSQGIFDYQSLNQGGIDFKRGQQPTTNNHQPTSARPPPNLPKYVGVDEYMANRRSVGRFWYSDKQKLNIDIL